MRASKLEKRIHRYEQIIVNKSNEVGLFFDFNFDFPT